MNLAKTLLSCFNPKRNFHSIFVNDQVRSLNLDVFNGIRVIFALWTCYGHVMSDHLQNLGANATVFYDRIKSDRWLSIITNSTVMTDAFFMFSGFLAIQACAKIFQDSKDRNVWTILKCYIGRYIRIMTLLSIMDIIFIIGTEGGKMCTMNSWWMSFLLLNNLTKMWGQCLGATWYFCCDFQFFLIVPFIAIILNKYRKMYTVLLITGLAIASLVIQMYLAYKYDLHLWVFDFAMLERQYDHYYVTAYCRIVPYFMGIGFYLLLTSKNSLNDFVAKSKWFKYILYLIAAVLIFAVFWIYPEFYMHEKQPLLYGALYNTFHKELFTLGIMLIIYPAILKNSNFFAPVLGCKPFIWLGKISYGIFLFHPLISAVYVPLMAPKALDFLLIMKDTLVVFVAATIVSFFLTVGIEAPVNQIAKLALAGEPRKKTE